MGESTEKPFNINISEDCLRVYLELLPHKKKQSPKQITGAIITSLKQLKVSCSIDQKKIKQTLEQFIETGITPPEVLIAKGIPCVHKQKTGLKWFVEPSKPYDYSRVVAPDQLLAHTISAPDGVEGKDVYGLTIKPQEKEDQQITAGSGVVYKSEQNPETGTEQVAYYAHFLGIMSLVDNILTVRPIVNVSDSKLSVQIELYGFLADEARSKVNILHILDTLERMNIHYGWDAKLMQTALFNSHRIKPKSLKDQQPEQLTIVKGKPPVAGKFAELEWKINYQSDKLIDRVIFPGQNIASYQSIEEPKPGVDVFGEVIPIEQSPSNILENGEGIDLLVKDKKNYCYVANYIGVLDIAEKINLQPLLSVSEDSLTAYLELPIYTRKDKKEITYAEVQKSLEAMNIGYGIHIEEIKQHLSEINSGKIQADQDNPFVEIVVAKGKAAKNGVDARLELNHSLTAGKLLENGSIDFKERSYPWNVKKDDEIGKKIPLVPAQKGMDVFNNPIEVVDAKDLTLTVTGIHHSPDGKLYASLDGVLIVNKTNLAVTETLVLSGDVSGTTGNIHTDSTVMVKGVVDPGFMVETKADIIIDVNIEKATAKAGGNIIIHGGVRGNRSLINAKGEVHAKFMEHADVHSDTDIIISENAMDCNFSANNSIIAGDEENKNCSVIGGHLHAANKISVGELGCTSDIKTALSVGYTTADIDRLEELGKTIENSQKRFDHIENIYASTQAVGMSDEVMMMMAELEPLGKQIDALTNEKTDLANKIENAKESCIEVHKKAHPGVSITICNQTITLNREYNRGKFCLENDKIVFNDL